MEPIRVLLADDEAKVNRGLRGRLGLERDCRARSDTTTGGASAAPPV